MKETLALQNKGVQDPASALEALLSELDGEASRLYNSTNTLEALNNKVEAAGESAPSGKLDEGRFSPGLLNHLNSIITNIKVNNTRLENELYALKTRI